jgi:hypothetical protein
MYFVLVAGNGESSRANTEALMEDHYYAKGDEGTLVLAYEKSPTKSQTFAAQYAKEKNKDIMVFCHEDAQTTGIPGASQSPSNDPIKDATEFLKGQDAIAFLLWSEEDTALLVACQSAGIPASNLCDGLVPLNEIPAPKITEPIKVKPPVEQLEFDLVKSIEELHRLSGVLLEQAKKSK